VSVLVPATTARARNGMVCSIDHLASQAGIEMMRGGGSAADAAVATSAVLSVTSPHLCGAGGDLLAVVVPPDGTPVALNASGRAGSGADPDRLRSEGHRTMPFRGDIRSVPVPGCVDGWLALHQRYGRLPLERVLGPARAYAADGFPASPTLAASSPAVAGVAGAEDITSLPVLRTGATVHRPGMARALEAVAARGRDGFYGGEFGQALLSVGSGEYTEADLETPLADWVDPLVVEAWGRRLWTVPPNSQGYLTLAASWMAAGLGLPEDPADPLWAHLLIEAARQASADRVAVLHEKADGASLVSASRLAPRRAAIDPDRAAVLAGAYRTGDTIALCTADGQGMGVSILQSNASGFGSHLALPGLGIFLHNRGIGFSLEPGHPGEYGPGRRPAHTLSPLAVTHANGALAGVAGSMGGDGQPQYLLQVLARWLVAGEEPGPAVAAGRWSLKGGQTGFDSWAAGGDDLEVSIEGHAPAGWADGLVSRGHRVVGSRPFDHGFGHAHLITVEDGHLAGGTDPRPRNGAACGY
jgi:gamma-glutamyltranspeptidase / glutathione hydrolase